MKKLLWIAMLAFAGFVGCTQIDGECYPRGEGPGSGAGGGVITPGGLGGFGDEPPPEPQDADDLPPGCATEACNEQGLVPDDGTFVTCSTECRCSSAVHGFSPSVFKFMVVVPDDGEGSAGGYQSATATLKFVRTTSLLPETWPCKITVGMPIRTQTYGTISPATAASITATIATVASKAVMDEEPDLPGGIFCSRFPTAMNQLFKSAYPGLGASVK